MSYDSLVVKVISGTFLAIFLLQPPAGWLGEAGLQHCAVWGGGGLRVGHPVDGVVLGELVQGIPPTAAKCRQEVRSVIP